MFKYGHLKAILALMLPCLLLPTWLYGAGINADSIIENVTIGSGKSAQHYVLMNSRVNEHQWYCARLNPTLVEIGQGKAVEPDLTLIRLQKVDSRNPEKLADGGTLQFSFAIGPDKASLIALRNKLPKSVNQRLARLDPLPMTGLAMTLLDLRGKKVTLVATSSQGIAADYASQFARFSAVFPTLDTDLIETLLKLPTGLKFELNYRYVTLSEKKKVSARVDYQSLSSKKAPDEILDSSGMALDAEILRYLKRQAANPRVSQRIKAAAQKKTNADQPPASGSDDPRDYGKKGRDDNTPKISDLVADVTLVHRSREQKVLAAQGFLSLSSYPEVVQKKRIINEISYDNWKNAWLLLPTIGELPELAINKVLLKVSLADKRHIYAVRSYEWTPENQWLDEDKAPAALARFPLKNILAGGVNALESAAFKVEYTILADTAPPLIDSDVLAVFTGDIPMAEPVELADILTFDFTYLYWDAPESDKGRLLKIELNIQDDKRKISRFVAPIRRSDKTTIYPEQVPILITRGNFEKPGKVKAVVYFHTADGKRVPWDFNGMNLSETFSGSFISFLDNDWQIGK